MAKQLDTRFVIIDISRLRLVVDVVVLSPQVLTLTRLRHNLDTLKSWLSLQSGKLIFKVTQLWTVS